MENFSEQQIQTALNFYERHKEAHKRYRQSHKGKMADLSKSYYYRMKEDPEKYEKYLDRCRKRYIPKNKKSEEMEGMVPTNI